MFLVYLLVILVPLMFLLNRWNRRCFKFFEERGIKHLEPVFFFGNSLPNFTMRKHQTQMAEELCRKYPQEPILGVYMMTKPIYICANAEYIEKMLIKDFAHFMDHGFEDLFKKSGEPFDESLFTMTGKKWRAFRYKLSPLFTTGKLRGMFTCMVNCCEGLTNFIKTKPLQNVNIKNIAGMFSLDVFGSSIFGIETRVMENPDCEYHKYGKMAFNMKFFDFIRMMLLSFAPGFIVRMIGLTFNKKEVIAYFSKTIHDTFQYRLENNIHRNDLIQLLLQLKEKGQVEIQHWDPNDEYLKIDEVPVDKFEITDELLTVFAFSFLIGGYDGLSLALTYSCFELAQNQDAQDKARQEVQEKVKSHSGLTYEACKAMIFLENVVKETLRLHPVAPVITRCCTSKEYKFPNGLVLKRGEVIQIPVRAVHLNPDNHYEPKSFKPERFEHPIKPGAYIPFGDGPRVCIAVRYVLLHVKIAVATILMNYRIKLNQKTELPIVLSPLSFFTMPKNDIIFDLEPILA